MNNDFKNVNMEIDQIDIMEKMLKFLSYDDKDLIVSLTAINTILHMHGFVGERLDEEVSALTDRFENDLIDDINGEE